MNMEDYYSRTEVQDKIRRDFARNYANSVKDLKYLIAENDTDNAIKLAHTLKGLGRYMKENTMAEAAERIERNIKKSVILPLDIQILESEVNKILSSVKSD